jgi:universal stress protein E
MRGSPVPVLFVQADQEWKTNRVLACVDLESEDPRHARLNDLIAGAARAVAGALGMEIYLASAYADRLNLTGMRVEGRAPEAAVDIIAEHFGIDPARVHLRRTETVSALEALCAELAPSILVMGTLARTGIKGKLIGNTAEKLLDVGNADILTVS